MYHQSAKTKHFPNFTVESSRAKNSSSKARRLVMKAPSGPPSAWRDSAAKIADSRLGRGRRGALGSSVAVGVRERAGPELVFDELSDLLLEQAA